MRNIPPDLFSKIQKQNQTIYNNANPKMSVTIARAKTTVTDSKYWTVETIREGENLGDVSVAPRRFSSVGPPNRIYEIHVENGIVGTSIREYPDQLKDGWKNQFVLGAGSSVAIAFDGDWVQYRNVWRLITYTEPWIFWVDSSGVLWTQLWNDETTRKQLASNTVSVRAIRAWKNIRIADHDQGIVAGYLKSDGRVYYRNYCFNDGVYVWDVEREITEFTGVAVSVNLFLTNDYRVGFAIEDSQSNIHWLISERKWAGMALDDHTIKVHGAGLSIQFTGINELTGAAQHNISVSSESEIKYCPAIWPTVEKISNPGPDDTIKILIKCDMELYGTLEGLQQAFSVKEVSTNTEYEVLSTEKVGDIIKLTVEDFQGASGDLVVSYDFSKGSIYAQVEGGCMMELASFSIAFTPDVSPPEGFLEHTVAITGEPTVDFISVSYETGKTEHTVAITGSISITFIYIDDIQP